MASIQKHGDGWRALVRRKGHAPKTKKFSTKAQAVAWANKIEFDIESGNITPYSDKTLSDAFDKYAAEVSTKKAGERWEVFRLELFKRDTKLSSSSISEVSKSDISAWRDRRLKQVSASSVRREWSLLSNVFTRAMNEWEWITKHPMKGVELPEKAPPRERRISQNEITNIQFALGYVKGIPETKSQRVALAFEFACETAMRAQEICNLRRSDIVGSTAAINKSKTRAGVRIAPLTPRAVEILSLFPTDDLFDVTPALIDSLFRKAKGKLMITDMTFHDSRHEGITRLAQKLQVLDLARAIGHQDLKQLLIYYNPTAEEMADKLK